MPSSTRFAPSARPHNRCPPTADVQWLIVGGGIAALSAAEALQRRGDEFLLFEKKARVGGWIETEHTDGYELEWGPNSLQGSAVPVFELLERVSPGEDTLVEASPHARNRYVLRGGRLRAMPLGPGSFLSSSVVSPLAKLRILCEPLLRSRSKEGESVAEFIRRRLGRATLDYVVNPFVSGIYGGIPEELEVRAAFPALVELERKGGLIVGGMRAMKQRPAGSRRGTFCVSGGMQRLPQLIATLCENRIRTEVEVTAVRQEPSNGKRWRVSYEEEGVQREITCQNLVLGTPARVTAQLLEPELDGVRESLEAIPHASIAVVHVGVPHDELPRPLDGFGFLVPKRETAKILGAIWSSAVFPHRAPPGHALISVFLGGRSHAEVAELPIERLRMRALDGLFDAMGGGFSPTLMRPRVMRNCIPQYTQGHLGRVAAVEEAVASRSGLTLCGSYLSGVSIPKCVESGRRAVGLVAPSR